MQSVCLNSKDNRDLKSKDGGRGHSSACGALAYRARSASLQLPVSQALQHMHVFPARECVPSTWGRSQHMRSVFPENEECVPSTWVCSQHMRSVFPACEYVPSTLGVFPAHKKWVPRKRGVCSQHISEFPTHECVPGTWECTRHIGVFPAHTCVPGTWVSVFLAHEWVSSQHMNVFPALVTIRSLKSLLAT